MSDQSSPPLGLAGSGQGGRGSRKLTRLGAAHLTPEQQVQADEAFALEETLQSQRARVAAPPRLADAADAATDEDVRVNFRWGSNQLGTVKEAARLAGVPYQTNMKLVLFRAAQADVMAAREGPR